MREIRGSSLTIDATAISTSEELGPSPSGPAGTRAQRMASVRRESDSRDAVRSAFRDWSKIRDQLRAANQWTFFLDFDGTLVNLRWRPGDVRMSRQAKLILQRLAAHENVHVVIVSGRKLQSIRKLVALKGVRYFGVHGGEPEGRPVELERGRDSHSTKSNVLSADSSDRREGFGLRTKFSA